MNQDVKFGPHTLTEEYNGLQYGSTFGFVTVWCYDPREAPGEPSAYNLFGAKNGSTYKVDTSACATVQEAASLMWEDYKAKVKETFLGILKDVP